MNPSSVTVAVIIRGTAREGHTSHSKESRNFLLRRNTLLTIRSCRKRKAVLTRKQLSQEVSEGCVCFSLVPARSRVRKEATSSEAHRHTMWYVVFPDKQPWQEEVWRFIISYCPVRRKDMRRPLSRHSLGPERNEERAVDRTFTWRSFSTSNRAASRPSSRFVAGVDDYPRSDWQTFVC